MTRESLLFDLYVAYRKARRHKASRSYVRRFEQNLYDNLCQLRDALWERRYHPGRSMCFIVCHPKKREVFAAEFVDRIVHHLYYDWTHQWFESTFIADSYSCIKGRGTHYGIERLEHHIRSESRNYTRPCYVLKLDIRGYFMSIYRPLLLDITMQSLSRSGLLDTDKGLLLAYLTHIIILHDPTLDCYVLATAEDYDGLDPNKRLVCALPLCGLPIGNLTSQLLSNVFLNIFDQWMKRTMHCRHYGRYVDDAYAVSADRQFLINIRRQAKMFLGDVLRLRLHEGKSRILDVCHGVEFLGAYLMPRRRYISNQSLRRMRQSESQGVEALISRTGILKHYRSHRIRRNFFLSYHSTAE